MTVYETLKQELVAEPRTWLITGVAGFIGSNLLETLLGLDQHVIGIDNFSTGYQHNLDAVQSLVTASQWQRFNFINMDIRDADACMQACKGVDYVLHQAALGSVPLTIEYQQTTNANNITGFLKILVAAKDSSDKRFV